MRRASIVRFAMISLVLGAGVFLYVAALQTSETVRFEFGSMDWDFLGNPEAFEKRNRMDGPIRYPDGSVEVIQFYGRIALDNAEIRLPYHARRSPLRLRIRCHRFGLSGSVELTVNGVLLEEFVFGETSYPWAGIQAIVPQSVAEQGPLVIGLRTHAGREPPSHLPETIGVGLDWIEVEPLSQGVRLVPMSAPLIAAALLPLLCFLFLSATRASFRMAVVGAMVAAGLSAALTHLAPAMSGMALARLWVVFPMGYGLWLLLLRRSSLAESEAAFVSRAFILVIFAQSILIFFPNHAPPDIANHLPQVEWLRSLDLTFDELHRYSSSSDPFDDGHVRPHFGVNYGAPYPPLFYIMTFATTFVHGDIRFLIEFLSVALSAALMVLVFLIARTIWDDVRVACFSVLLLVFEISIWHHAHRAHRARYPRCFRGPVLALLSHRAPRLHPFEARPRHLRRFLYASGADLSRLTCADFYFFYIYGVVPVAGESRRARALSPVRRWPLSRFRRCVRFLLRSLRDPSRPEIEYIARPTGLRSAGDVPVFAKSNARHGAHPAKRLSSLRYLVRCWFRARSAKRCFIVISPQDPLGVRPDLRRDVGVQGSGAVSHDLLTRERRSVLRTDCLPARWFGLGNIVAARPLGSWSLSWRFSSLRQRSSFATRRSITTRCTTSVSRTLRRESCSATTWRLWRASDAHRSALSSTRPLANSSKAPATCTTDERDGRADA